MHVSIQAPYDEHLVVVLDRMTPKEVFWLLEARLLPFDLIRLGVEAVAVGDPAVVSTKNQNFAVAEGKASNSVSGGPKTIFIY